MSSNYWGQWDKGDLDSWQGKDYLIEEDEGLDDEDGTDPEVECQCGYFCMDCLGMSFRDFM